ncbi:MULTISPECIES: hypothetical protein [Thalassolituus]|uniref:hypothetical protein n=1 Tax=Thalassolituus TaxID=187492 RepID=UPI00042DC37C|nr:hypothetical protein [Thalassolituus oleivorans]AHK17921.1 hypothetical protein R615_16810 [Thalassolituus oleivorans R6-15]APR65441.1 hypothetical protein CN03_00020 [Thalassolituus oleivorans]MCA6126860.1 hypothetical protein [Thalassolituus oleivorans 4BN06-13]
MKFKSLFLMCLLILIYHKSYSLNEVGFFQIVEVKDNPGFYNVNVGFNIDVYQGVVVGVDDNKTRQSILIKINDTEVESSKLSFKSPRCSNLTSCRKSDSGVYNGFHVIANNIAIGRGDVLAISGAAVLKTNDEFYEEIKNRISSLKAGDKIYSDKVRWEVNSISNDSISFKCEWCDFSDVFFKSKGLDVRYSKSQRFEYQDGKSRKYLEFTFSGGIDVIDSWGLRSEKDGDSKLIILNQKISFPF